MQLINLSSIEAATDLVECAKNTRKTNFPNTYTTFVNPFSYNKIPNSSSFDYIFADGGSLCIAHNIFNKIKVKRISFDLSSIGKEILEVANYRRLKLSIIGGKPNEIMLSVQNLNKLYPNINIIYYRDGYFDSTHEKYTCIKKIKSIKPHITLIGMGTPLQEEFLMMLKEIKCGGMTFTCGGFISQTSEKPDYYHPIIKFTKLFWLQRAWNETHVRKRLLKDYPIFFIRFILSNLKQL